MVAPLHRLLAGPLLIRQALSVRRTALRLPEAAGPRAGRLGQGAPLSLLIIGDSSAAGVGVVHQEQALAGQIAALLGEHFDLSWRLLARTGATTGSTLRALRRMPEQPADVVITALGVNDVTHGVPFSLWYRQQRRLIAGLSQKCQPRHIYLTGIPPMGAFPLLPEPLRSVLGRRAARFDSGLSALCRTEPPAIHVPFGIAPDPSLIAADGFHPNAALYALWAKEMASRIVSDWPESMR